MTPPTDDGQSVHDIVAETLVDHPVSVGLLFGSQAREATHDRSDVDVAVAFEEETTGHFEAQLTLGGDLALALGTDDVDIVDLRRAPPSLVRAVFRDGDLLVGTQAEANRLKKALLEDAPDEQRSPAERFDDALAAIDDYLA